MIWAFLTSCVGKWFNVTPGSNGGMGAKRRGGQVGQLASDEVRDCDKVPGGALAACLGLRCLDTG
jgi:hypothetical protein